MCPQSIFFILYLFSTISTVISAEETCERTCNFNQPEVTSKTMELWPSTCKTVCGNLIFNANMDITQYQLPAYFRNLRTLKGYLKIEDTNLTSFSFFTKLSRIDCSSTPLTIVRNLQLTNAEKIQSLEFYMDEKCLWDIYDNPQLDVTPLCDTTGIDKNVFGNLKDCGCRSVQINSDSLKYFQNCTKILTGTFSGLTITKVSDGSRLSALSSIKSIVGNLEVYDTGLEDLSFLSNLKTIQGGENNIDAKMIYIHDNPQLKRLGLDSLQQLIIDPGNFHAYVTIENVHPDFCLSLSEAEAFADDLMYFGNPDSTTDYKYCKDLTMKNGEKVCYFEKMSSLESDCVHLIGDVVVDKGDEGLVEKLHNVTNIHGSLTIQNTELSDLSFLRRLHNILTMSESEPPFLGLFDNPQLSNISLPSLKHIFPPSGFNLILDGNAPGLLKNGKECMILEMSTGGSVRYNDMSCGALTTQYQANNTKTTVKTNSGKSTTTKAPRKGTTSIRSTIAILIVSLFSIFE